MLYDYPLLCQLPISRFVFISQRFVLTAFCRYLAVAMHLLHSLITAVQLCPGLFIERQLTFFKHFEVMRFTLVMSDAQNALCLPGYYQLYFQGMPLLFARIVLLLLFLGRSMGISVASMTTTLTS
jgi:hypothetical protein